MVSAWMKRAMELSYHRRRKKQSQFPTRTARPKHNPKAGGTGYHRALCQWNCDLVRRWLGSNPALIAGPERFLRALRRQTTAGRPRRRKRLLAGHCPYDGKHAHGS